MWNRDGWEPLFSSEIHTSEIKSKPIYHEQETLNRSSVLRCHPVGIGTDYEATRLPHHPRTVHIGQSDRPVLGSTARSQPQGDDTACFQQMRGDGTLQNFEHAAHPSDTIHVTGYSFDDTDVYKTIEGLVICSRHIPTRNWHTI